MGSRPRSDPRYPLHSSIRSSAATTSATSAQNGRRLGQQVEDVKRLALLAALTALIAAGCELMTLLPAPGARVNVTGSGSFECGSGFHGCTAWIAIRPAAWQAPPLWAPGLADCDFRPRPGDNDMSLWLVSGSCTGGPERLAPGDYALPFQCVSTILLGPGCTVSHDALRLLSRHGTALVAVGEDGVRFYASMPFGSDDSRRARRQAMVWADPGRRVGIARRMYAWRLGELLPSTDINVLSRHGGGAGAQDV